MEADDWIEHKTSDGKQAITYDSEITTKEQAEAKGYKGVEKVFKDATGYSADGEEFIAFAADGNYTVNNGAKTDVDDASYTTKGGVHISENKGVVDAVGDFGPGALQKGGDITTKGAGIAALTGAEPVAAILGTIGSTMSAVGVGGKILNDAFEGKFDLKNALFQAASEGVNRYLKKISGDDTVKKIMLENGVNEVGKGFEELNK